MTRRTKGMKTVQCRTGCGRSMEISEDSVSGVCWRCVNDMVAGRPVGAAKTIYDNTERVARTSTPDMTQDEVDSIISDNTK